MPAGLGSFILSKDSISHHLQAPCRHHITCSLWGTVGEFGLVKDMSNTFCKSRGRWGGLPLSLWRRCYPRGRVGSDEMTDQSCSCCVHHVLSLGFEFNCFPYRFEEREWFITKYFVQKCCTDKQISRINVRKTQNLVQHVLWQMKLFYVFPIDLSAFNGPICKQQCFQTLKDHVYVCVCVFGEGWQREKTSHSFISENEVLGD